MSDNQRSTVVTTGKESVHADVRNLKPYKNGRFVIGDPSGTFDEKPRNARQPGKNSHRHDLAADIARMGDMLVMGASLRGAMHYGLSTIRQDSLAIGSESNTNDCKWIIAAIADGVSSASQSHTFSDFMARQAVLAIGEALNSSSFDMLHNVELWRKVANHLVGISDEFCRTAAKRTVTEDKTAEVDKALPKDFVQKWATTLEFVVIQASSDNMSAKKEFVHVTVAGDGATYVVNKKGWDVIKSGKKQSGSLASNAVLSLPLPPDDFIIEFGCLNKNDCLILTTDGLSDFIGDGNTQLGAFFKSKLPKCESLASFLQIVDVSLYQADDDRTIIMIKGDE